MTEPLTASDLDQIIEGIKFFIIEGNTDLMLVWKPYIDKLRALRDTLTVDSERHPAVTDAENVDAVRLSVD